LFDPLFIRTHLDILGIARREWRANIAEAHNEKKVEKMVIPSMELRHWSFRSHSKLTSTSIIPSPLAMSNENDPFYLRYVPGSFASILLLALTLTGVQILVRLIPKPMRFNAIFTSIILLQHWTFWQTWPRVSRIRILAWPFAIRQQLEL
jgi:hypothetical protein